MYEKPRMTTLPRPRHAALTACLLAGCGGGGGGDAHSPPPAGATAGIAVTARPSVPSAERSGVIPLRELADRLVHVTMPDHASKSQRMVLFVDHDRKISGYWELRGTTAQAFRGQLDEHGSAANMVLECAANGRLAQVELRSSGDGFTVALRGPDFSGPVPGTIAFLRDGVDLPPHTRFGDIRLNVSQLTLADGSLVHGVMGERTKPSALELSKYGATELFALSIPANDDHFQLSGFLARTAHPGEYRAKLFFTVPAKLSRGIAPPLQSIGFEGVAQIQQRSDGRLHLTLISTSPHMSLWIEGETR